jgi:ubiquinone/menaquinone biosynthesis C-methylase UbiE
MSAAPTAQDQFDEQASNTLTAIYLTPDVVAQRDKVLALLAPKAGERALDIGCGPGLTTEALARAVGPQGGVLGVDIAPPMLTIAQQRCASLPQVTFGMADVTQLPYQAASFDIALASQVYEYVEQIDQALTELARVIRPGGRAVLVDTDWESAVWACHDDARMRRVIETWNEHIPHPQLPRTLKRRMEAAGFSQVRVEVVPLLNLAYDPNTYSVGMMTMLGNFATGRNGLSADDIAAWKADARAIGDKNEYFFSLNRYVFIGHRAASSLP